jgi:large subunit ribosomal protein L25
MAKQTILKAVVRNETGTGPARRMRRQGKLPAVVSMLDGRSVPITLNHHEFDLTLRSHSGDNVLMDLDLEGSAATKVLLVEVQRDGVTGATEHADFHEISMTKKMRVHIPVQVIGDPVGVLLGGGILEQTLRELEVDVLPADMIDLIEADVSGLNVGDALLVKDLKIGERITVVTPADTAVASVLTPAAVEEEKPAEEAVAAEGDAAAAAKEPALVEKKKKKDEEAG